MEQVLYEKYKTDQLRLRIDGQTAEEYRLKAAILAAKRDAIQQIWNDRQQLINSLVEEPEEESEHA